MCTPQCLKKAAYAFHWVHLAIFWIVVTQGIDLGERLRLFYQRHYSSHYMTVAIMSTGTFLLSLTSECVCVCVSRFIGWAGAVDKGIILCHASQVSSLWSLSLFNALPLLNLSSSNLPLPDFKKCPVNVKLTLQLSVIHIRIHSQPLTEWISTSSIEVQCMLLLELVCYVSVCVVCSRASSRCEWSPTAVAAAMPLWQISVSLNFHFSVCITSIHLSSVISLQSQASGVPVMATGTRGRGERSPLSQENVR